MQWYKNDYVKLTTIVEKQQGSGQYRLSKTWKQSVEVVQGIGV